MTMTQNKTQQKPKFKAPLKDSDIFSRDLIKKRRERIATNFTNHAFLNQEISARLIDNLQDIKRDFKTILNMNGHDQLIKHALPQSLILKQDLALTMIKNSSCFALQADEELIPIQNQCLDLVLSCLNLHWVNDLPGTLVQLLSCLKPDGLFIAAMLGGETLTELRQAMMKADIDHLGGISPHISPFIDVRDAGALLQRVGFALPVVSTERITVTYTDAFALMKELKAMGENNALIKRSKGLSSPKLMMKVAEVYHDMFADDTSRIPATFDIIYLQGWAPDESQQKPLKPGSAKMSLKDALGAMPPENKNL